MTSYATPNLPARDFGATSAFYGRLGFDEVWRDPSWLILRRETVTLEFFPHPELQVSKNWFSCSLRLDDADEFYAVCRVAGIGETGTGQPRLHPLERQPWGSRMGALVDLDGTLLRLIES